MIVIVATSLLVHYYGLLSCFCFGYLAWTLRALEWTLKLPRCSYLILGASNYFLQLDYFCLTIQFVSTGVLAPEYAQSQSDA